jgi:hypothetical protein
MARVCVCSGVKRFDFLPASFAFSNFLLDHQALHAAMRAQVELERAREIPRIQAEEPLDELGPRRAAAGR